MNLVQCESGHYYDGDKFESCPHCSDQGAANKVAEDVTVSAEISAEAKPPKHKPLNTVTDAPDGEKTIGFYASDAGVEPVVGWLVCIEGSEFGRSFALKAGKNFIGRAPIVNDIVLAGDNTVSREKHAIVIYDPKSRNFLVQPGMSSELFYVNDEVVLQASKISDKDIISIGNAKLMFVPCCGPDFTWDDLQK